MRQSVPPLLPLFRSEMQVRLLGLVLLEPDRDWTIDSLLGALDAARPSVHRELQRAISAGLVVRDSSRRPHTYRAATDSAAYAPLRDLLQSTVGVEADLRRYFANADGVEAAAIFGSWARGEALSGSDIDVLVIGSVDAPRVHRDVRRIARRAGREADVLVLSRKEFATRRRRRDGFTTKLLREPRIELAGRLGQRK